MTCTDLELSFSNGDLDVEYAEFIMTGIPPGKWEEILGDEG